jgi:hypothetical protein
MKVAALFVRVKSHYKQMSDVDAYDQNRDALTFPGGLPGVYHPPCRSWGKLSHFAKPAPGERELAIWSMDMVRRFGGVLEHPIDSRLWKESRCLGYGLRDDHGGILIPLHQSWFGHEAPKPTAIYVVGPVPDLSSATCQHVPTGRIERMCTAQRERTPLPFAQWLVELAKRCEVSP